jgi:hypothetical protein
MKIAEPHIAAIQSFGYTEDEARFLYIVATHSGYFLPRQFIAFTGTDWGKRSNKFGHKIESRGHAGWREYQGAGRVYHLFSKTFYSEIGKENLRNRRRHSTEFIRTRLVLLDFIIENQQYDYLETEQQKVQYFCNRLGLPKKSLPAKAYESKRGSTPTLRYFVDKYPLFFDSPGSSSSPVVTFSFVDPGLASVKAFATHLDAYRPLLGELPEFRFLYIATSNTNFAAAEICFSKRFASKDSHDPSEEILRYFRLRRAWEQEKYGLFSNHEIEALNDAAKRFQGRRFETLYSQWLAGGTDAQSIRREFTSPGSHRKMSFAPYLVRDTCSPSNARPQRGEVDFTPALHP